MLEKRLRMLGIFGIISLLSYTAMVVFSPLANQLNALFGPCGLVSIMAVCVGIVGCKSKVMKLLRVRRM